MTGKTKNYARFHARIAHAENRVYEAAVRTLAGARPALMESFPEYARHLEVS